MLLLGPEHPSHGHNQGQSYLCSSEWMDLVNRYIKHLQGMDVVTGVRDFELQ